MSEPQAGLPPQAGQPSGISEPAGQPQTSQTPAATTPPTSGAQTPPAAPQAPDLAKLQKERDDAIAYARQLQSDRDKKDAQLKAMAGVTPPADPLAPHRKAFIDRGFTEQDADLFVSQMQAMVAPVLQQNQQLQAAVQGQTLAQTAYQQAAEANPELFRDPKVQQAAWNALNEAALAGQTQYIHPSYAYRIAAQEWADLNQPWKQPSGSATPPPQPFRPAGVMNFGGNGSAYAPNAQPHQQQQPEDPAVKAAADEMAKRWSGGKTLSQLQQPTQ